MNAQQAIDAFDAACEQDTAQRLRTPAQRYGEAPVVLGEAEGAWDQPVGSGDPIQQWRHRLPARRRQKRLGRSAGAAQGCSLRGGADAARGPAPMRDDAHRWI